VEVTSFLFAGAGGNGFAGADAGDGAGAALVDATRGSTSGLLSLSQFAHAGWGGDATGGGAGGDGGDASSILDAANPGGGALHVTAESRAGAGGAADYGSGIGGDAFASATARSAAATSALAAAYGGFAAPGLGGGGSALAVLDRLSLAPEPLTRLAASAHVARGDHSGAAAWAEARWGEGAPDPLDIGLNATAFVAGLPAAPDVSAALAGDAEVLSAIGDGTVLALAQLGGVTPPGVVGAPIASEGSVTMAFDPTLFSSIDSLLIGFLDPEVLGAGFDSLHVWVEFDGSLAFDQTFDSAAAAFDFFDDATLFLGARPAPTDPLELLVAFSMLGDESESGFAFDWVVASVPEPRLAILLAFALVGLLVWRAGRRVPTA
jgi:hypothetical protein